MENICENNLNKSKRIIVVEYVRWLTGLWLGIWIERIWRKKHFKMFVISLLLPFFYFTCRDAFNCLLRVRISKSHSSFFHWVHFCARLFDWDSLKHHAERAYFILSFKNWSMEWGDSKLFSTNCLHFPS